MYFLFKIKQQSKGLEKIIKNKFINICFVISILFSVFLIGYDIAYKPECKHEHLENINWEYDCVSSEELALKFAGAAVGFEDDWEKQNNFSYIAKCTYNIERYEWIVTFIPRDTLSMIRVIGIRRDNHLITCLLYTSPSPRD